MPTGSRCHLFSFLAITSCAVAGCSGGSNDSDSGFRPPVANPDSSLIGMWDGLECSTTANFSQNLAYFFRPDGTYDFSVNSFTDLNCTQPSFLISSSGSYFEGSTRVNVNDRTIVDLDIQQTTERSLTPLNETTAASLNNDQLCERTDWTVGVTQSIGGCQIGEVTEVIPPTLFRVYNIENNQFLFFSDERSVSPENRSTLLQARPIAVRELAPESDFPAEIFGLWERQNPTQFLEFRQNGFVYAYTNENLEAGCLDLAITATVSQGDNFYQTFDGDELGIMLTGTDQLQYSEPSGTNSGQYARATTIQSNQLTPCSAVAGG